MGLVARRRRGVRAGRRVTVPLQGALDRRAACLRGAKVRFAGRRARTDAAGGASITDDAAPARPLPDERVQARLPDGARLR